MIEDTGKKKNTNNAPGVGTADELVQGHQSTLNTPRKEDIIRIVRIFIGRLSKHLKFCLPV